MVEREHGASILCLDCLLLIEHVCLDEHGFPAAVQRCMLMNYGMGRGSPFDDMLSRFVWYMHFPW